MDRFVAPTEIPEGMGSSAADGVFPREVTHTRGTMTVAQRPERIVVLATGQLDQALNLGIVPVGTTINGFPDHVPPYLAESFPHYADQLAHVMPVGARTELDFEAIAALKPDVIVGTNAGAHGRAFNELSAIAPTFLTEGYGYNWKRDFRFFAELMGERDTATAIMEAYHQRAVTMRLRLAEAGRNRDEVSFMRIGPKGLEIYGEKAFVGTIAEDLGLTRPDSQRFQEIIRKIGPDEVARLDGDWLFYAEIDYPVAQQARGAIVDAWPRLKAVSSGQVRRVAIEPWYTMVAPTAAGLVLDGIEGALLRSDL